MPTEKGEFKNITHILWLIFPIYDKLREGIKFLKGDGRSEVLLSRGRNNRF